VEDYNTPAADWRRAGKTPFKDVKVPRDYLRLEVRKAGYQTIELAVPMFSLRFRRSGNTSRWTAREPAGEHGSHPEVDYRYANRRHREIWTREVPEFLIDKFEITNKQFKAFVDAGGYANAAYWTVPIRTRPSGSVECALAKFTDRTGRQGPATWEAGATPMVRTITGDRRVVV